MSSTLGNDYVGATGPDGFRVWRPTPYPAAAVQSQDTSSQGSSSSGSGNSGGGTGSGTGGTTAGDGYVQAQALFLTATCKSADAIGNFVRADAGVNAVTTVTCFQPYPSIGCIISKSSSTQCVVQTYGLNNAYTALSANSRYFVGPQGQPILASALPSNAPYVQPIGFATQASQLFIQPSGTLYRRDTSSPAPPDQGGGDTVSNYYGGLLVGQGAPDDSLGQKNDVYLENDGTSNVAAWGPKPSPSSWGDTRISLVGAAGSRIYVGTGAPDPSIQPKANDLYLDQTQDAPMLYVAA